MAGLEVVSQGHVQLLLMRLHMRFWKRRSQDVRLTLLAAAEGEPRILLPMHSRGSALSHSCMGTGPDRSLRGSAGRPGGDRSGCSPHDNPGRSSPTTQMRKLSPKGMNSFT